MEPCIFPAYERGDFLTFRVELVDTFDPADDHLRRLVVDDRYRYQVTLLVRLADTVGPELPLFLLGHGRRCSFSGSMTELSRPMASPPADRFAASSPSVAAMRSNLSRRSCAS